MKSGRGLIIIHHPKYSKNVFIKSRLKESAREQCVCLESWHAISSLHSCWSAVYDLVQYVRIWKQRCCVPVWCVLKHLVVFLPGVKLSPSRGDESLREEGSASELLRFLPDWRTQTQRWLNLFYGNRLMGKLAKTVCGAMDSWSASASSRWSLRN